MAATVVGGLGLLALTPSAGAAESYPRPADRSFTITGHGNGHGHGMSQYGALGAARAGRTWQEILGFYYPNTTLGSMGNPTIRVRVASLGSTVQAVAAPGLRVSWNLTDSTVLPTTNHGATITRWRLLPDTKVSGTKTKVAAQFQDSTSSTWVPYAKGSVPLQGAFLNPDTGYVDTFRGSTPVRYRGEVRATLIGSAGAESLVPVVALPMDSYLRTVVPAEVPASWPEATLRAQAVAARSFAEWHRTNAPISKDFYDVYDDTRSQVFKPTSENGASNEYTATNNAVTATASTAVLYSGKAAFTQFSASSGGWSSDGGKPYLVAKRDDWDAVSDNPYNTWTRTVTMAQIESAYPSIGSFQSLTILSRNGFGAQGGRVLTARLTGSAGTLDRTGEQLRSLFGNGWSDWFTPTLESASSYPRDVNSDGRMDVLAVVPSTGALKVYPGTGSGAFKSAVVSAASGWGSYAKILTAGTWDADAVSDILVEDSSGRLFLRRGLGNNTFAAATQIGSGWYVHSAVLPVGDFDGDGLTDLLARRASDGTLNLYRGNGKGGFAGSRQVGTGWNDFTAIIGPGDFDGDGNVDVLGRRKNGTLWLYPGDGKGSWKTKRQVGTGWQGMTALVAGGDFTGDGNVDLLARTSAGDLFVYPGNGKGAWQTRRQVGHGWQSLTMLP